LKGKGLRCNVCGNQGDFGAAIIKTPLMNTEAEFLAVRCNECAHVSLFEIDKLNEMIRNK